MDSRDLLLAVFAQLEREHAVSIPQLSRMLGASEQDVWDALDELVFCYDAVGLRLELQDSFARLVKREREQTLRLTADETTLLLDILQAQGYAKDDELPRKLVRAKGALESSAGEASRIGSASFGDISSVLETVASACEDEEHHLLGIEYQKEGARTARWRTVEPWVITSEGDFRYLQAWCHDAGAWRSFRIDRIKSAAVLEETFIPHGGTQRPQGSRPKGAQAAHVRFSPETRLPSWPGLSATSENTDGSTDARIPWLGGLWLPKRIVGMFGACTPLDPPALVDACRSYAEELLE